MELLSSVPTVVWIILAVPVVLVAVLFIIVSLPKKMSEYTLKNGMKIWQWNKGETDFLYGEIFEDDLYTSRAITLKPGDTVFDCGANIGMFALFCHHKTGGDVHVHSFEPMPKIHAVLSKNAQLHGNGKLHAYKLGVSDKPASVTFEFHPHFSIWSTASAAFDQDRAGRISSDLPAILAQSTIALPSFIAVPLTRWFVSNVLQKVEKVQAELTTLSMMIDQTGVKEINLLKVDVEGHEVQAINGIEDRHWPMIQQVVLEAENFKAVAELRSILESKGFTVTSFASEREKTPDVSSEVSCVMAVRA